jgi:hypothetical protein
MITIDKKLIICLDECMEYTHLSHNTTVEAINQGMTRIVTPCVEFFSIYYTNKYSVFVVTKDETMSLNNMVNNKTIRYSQNATSMLLSGVFGMIKTEGSDF